MASQIILKTSQDSSQFKWFSVSLFTTVLLTRSWQALTIVRAWFRRFLLNRSHEDSLLFIVLTFVYFWNYEQINPAYANDRTTLYLQTLQWAFPVVSKNCAYERAKTKAHCKAKRNIFIRIEIQAGNPKNAGFWSQHFLVHWTVFCLAARAWSCSTAWRQKDRSSTGSWPRFTHCSLLQRGFPFDFLFLSDWMECFFDLLSIKVKLKYPVTASPTCPFMINRSLDYSCLISIRDALHCLWIDEVTIMYKICSLIVLSIIEQVVSWNLWLFFN